MNCHTFCFSSPSKNKQLVSCVIRPRRAGTSIKLHGNSDGWSWDHFCFFTLTWYFGSKTFFPITGNAAKFQGIGLKFSMLFPCLK